MTRHRVVTLYKTAANVILGLLVVIILINSIMFINNRYANSAPNDPIKHALESPFLKEVYPDQTPDEIIQLLNETWGKRAFSYEPFTQFKETAYNGKYVNVDKHGFRHSQDQGPWPPDPENYNVFIFGGSTTFGYGVSDGQTIASHIQKCLNERMRRGVRVYNFGRGFYYYTQERVLFETLLVSGFIPDLAIFIDGLNASSSREGDMPYFSNCLKTVFDEGDRRDILSRICGSFKRCMNALPITRHVNLWSSEMETGIKSKNEIKRCILNMNITDSIASVYNVKTAFVWQPVPGYKYDINFHIVSDEDSIYLKRTRTKYNYMVETCRRHPLGNNFLWCADIQEGIQEPLYVDRVHYSYRMSEMLAVHITEMLFERKIVALHETPY